MHSVLSFIGISLSYNGPLCQYVMITVADTIITGVRCYYMPPCDNVQPIDCHCYHL